MGELDPEKLTVTLKGGGQKTKPIIPRYYTLTHSDFTGELFLTIGQKINKKQISKVYIRLMRDEIVGEWRKIDDDYQLHLHAHISGGLIFGWARLRDKIIRHHLPLVFSVIQYGDRKFFEKNPKLDKSPIFVHFHSKRKKFDSVENMGVPRNYRLSTTG